MPRLDWKGPGKEDLQRGHLSGTPMPEGSDVTCLGEGRPPRIRCWQDGRVLSNRIWPKLSCRDVIGNLYDFHSRTIGLSTILTMAQLCSVHSQEEVLHGKSRHNGYGYSLCLQQGCAKRPVRSSLLVQLCVFSNYLEAP